MFECIVLENPFLSEPPRLFGTDNLLVEYNFHEQSEGHYILETTFKGRFKNSHLYIIYFNNGGGGGSVKNYITLITNLRIVLVKQTNKE
ncbi:hypothetical protein DDB_G0274983 [Dictyostelium discoideum AX4]|uniref:Intermembrane lipid transfer protein VPS13-like C-terminal domain-containing protein n=1 Tax=Dictyostelium discoideum TaxID=44689 RepID=Q8T1A2_DICDI|nr:hypothetical protein DDB_G0274983 [Dictyostelium discoideum AX4]EAL70384.1 hypothetical protein DDB_G0274983 [Dictyostelium discoideum AX4]|eukprot:XP_644264.1 hypothetical protein DDB_G0274983 [Dictyostelium discoideum AX4]